MASAQGQTGQYQVDLHCHLLPGVDDGPDTLEQSLALARALVDDGVTHAVLTSHLNPELYPYAIGDLRRAVAELAAEMARAEIPLQVRMGAEARLCPELLDLLAADELPFLGSVDGWRILLLEFPHGLIPIGSERFVQHLLDHRVRPLLAHPERNKAIMAQPARLASFVDAGCWLQLTAASITGEFGEAAHATAVHIIEAGWHCLVASDAHGVGQRAPRMREAWAAIAHRYGSASANTLLRQRPARIFGLPH